jgi:hypothetical protein
MIIFFVLHQGYVKYTPLTIKKEFKLLNGKRNKVKLDLKRFRFGSLHFCGSGKVKKEHNDCSSTWKFWWWTYKHTIKSMRGALCPQVRCDNSSLRSLGNKTWWWRTWSANLRKADPSLSNEAKNCIVDQAERSAADEKLEVRAYCSPAP